ncbi:MAG: hypothetical protein WCW56_03020 [Candidatus Paceibacterota bacterium]|jgi:hypothetical protein
MAKERLYITDFTLHVRGFRQTAHFSKVEEKGRMYSPLPKDYAKSVSGENHSCKIAFDLPPDLQESIHRGEVEIMVPKVGIPVYAGRDVWEFVEKRLNQQRLQLIHNVRVWRSE